MICFSNKGDFIELQRAVRSIVSHAFDGHSGCGDWCRLEKYPDIFQHRNLPSGKRFVGSGLRPCLIETLEPYASDEVVKKIAPCGSRQRNGYLNGHIVRKTLKIRCYGVSESSDYQTAAAICQFDDGVSYLETVCRKHKHHSNKTTLSRFVVKRNLARSRQPIYSKTKEFKV